AGVPGGDPGGQIHGTLAQVAVALPADADVESQYDAAAMWSACPGKAGTAGWQDPLVAIRFQTASNARTVVAHADAALTSLGWALGDHPARIEHDVALGEAQGELHVLLHQYDRQPVRRVQLRDGVLDLDDHRRLDALGRLVEQQQPGPGHEGAGDGELLRLAAGEEPRLTAEELAKLGEEVEGLVQGCLPGGRRLDHDLQVLPHREARKAGPALRDIGEPRPHPLVGSPARDLPAVEGDAASGGLDHAHHRLDQGGLADAIAAHDAHESVVRHLHRDAEQHGRPPVPRLDAVDRQHAQPT